MSEVKTDMRIWNMANDLLASLSCTDGLSWTDGTADTEREVLLYYAVNRNPLRDGIVAAHCRERYGGGRYWYSPAFPLHDGDEIAWMPLPPPPKPEGEK